jgi:hypothetical protein
MLIDAEVAPVSMPKDKRVKVDYRFYMVRNSPGARR